MKVACFCVCMVSKPELKLSSVGDIPVEPFQRRISVDVELPEEYGLDLAGVVLEVETPEWVNEFEGGEKGVHTFESDLLPPDSQLFVGDLFFSCDESVDTGESGEIVVRLLRRESRDEIAEETVRVGVDERIK